MLLCQLWAPFICSSTGPRRAHIPTALLATSCVPVNHKTSEQAILYKGQQHLLEMITLLLFHLLKFKIAIYNSSWKRGTASQPCARMCLCVSMEGSACVGHEFCGGFFSFPGRTRNMWKFPDQGWNLCHRCDLCPSCSNLGCLTCCTTRELLDLNFKMQ